jgi:hypothetical protein
MAITIRAKSGDEWLSINSLPSVTAQDDGKSLVVKNGEWTVARQGAASSSSGRSVQANWNENDPYSMSYIKNRTHYMDPTATLKSKTIVDVTCNFESYNGACIAESVCPSFQLDDNAEVTLQIDDNEPTTHKAFSLMGLFVLIGNPLGYLSFMTSDSDTINIESPTIMCMNGEIMVLLPNSYGVGNHRIRITTKVNSCVGTVANTTVNAKITCINGMPLGVLGSCDEYIDLQKGETYKVSYNGNSYEMNAISYSDLVAKFDEMDDDGYSTSETSMPIEMLGLKMNFLGIEALYPLFEALAYAESENDIIPALMTDYDTPFILFSVSAMGMIERSFILDLTTKFTMDYGLKLNNQNIIPYGSYNGHVIPVEDLGLAFKHDITLQPGAIYQLTHNGKTYTAAAEVVFSSSDVLEGYKLIFGEQISDSYTITHPNGYRIEEEINYSTEVENGITYNVTTTYNGLTTVVERTAFIPVISFYQQLTWGYVMAIPNNYDVAALNGTVIPLRLKIDGAKEAYHKINRKFLPTESNLLSLIISLMSSLNSASGSSYGLRKPTGGDAIKAKIAANPVSQLVGRIPAKAFENPIVKTLIK